MAKMTKKAPKYKYLTAGMNGYEFDKNFWRKNAKVVEIDACEIIDRLFYCSLTCQLPFQVSISLHEIMISKIKRGLLENKGPAR